MARPSQRRFPPGIAARFTIRVPWSRIAGYRFAIPRRVPTSRGHHAGVLPPAQSARSGPPSENISAWGLGSTRLARSAPSSLRLPSVVSRVLALMQFVITSANFHAVGWETDRRTIMLLQPPQRRGFGVGVRFRTMSLRQSRMIQGPGLKSGRHAFGHGHCERSVAKLMGHTDDKTRGPKHRDGDPGDPSTPKCFGPRVLSSPDWHIPVGNGAEDCPMSRCSPRSDPGTAQAKSSER